MINKCPNSSIKHWLERDLRDASVFNDVVGETATVVIGCLPPPIIENIPQKLRSRTTAQIACDIAALHKKYLPTSALKESNSIASMLTNTLNMQVVAYFDTKKWQGKYGYCFQFRFPGLTQTSYALKFWDGLCREYPDSHGPFAEIRAGFAAAKQAPKRFARVWFASVSSDYRNCFMMSEWVDTPKIQFDAPDCNPRPVLGDRPGDLVCMDNGRANFIGRKCVDFGWIGRCNYEGLSIPYNIRKGLRSLRYAADASDFERTVDLYRANPALVEWVRANDYGESKYVINDLNDFLALYDTGR